MRNRSGYIIVALIVLVLIAITPWIDGICFKLNYLKNLAILNQGKYPLVVENYQLGWLNSTATLSFLVPNTSEKIIINQTISHGPFVKDSNSGIHFACANIKSNVHLPSNIEDILLGANAAQGIMQVNTVVHFGNKYIFAFHIPTIKFSNPMVQFNWEGFNGNSILIFKQDYISYLSADGKYGDLTLQLPTGKVFVKPITLKGIGTCAGANLLCNISGEEKFSGFDAALNNGKSVNLENFDFTYKMGSDENKYFNTDINASLAKLNILDYAISDASLSFGERNLNADKLNTIFSALRQQIATAGPNPAPGTLNEVFLASLTSLPEAIGANASFTLDFKATTTDGNINFAGNVDWPLSTAPANYFDFIQKMNSKINARANTKLIDHIIQLLDANDPNAKVVAPRPIVTTPIITTNKNADEFRKLVVDLVMQKQLTAQQGQILTGYVTTNRSDADFAVIANSLATQKVLPQIIVQLKMAYAKAEATTNAMPLPPLVASAEGTPDYKAQIDTLVAQKVISENVGAELLALQEQKLDPLIYNASIDKLVNSQDLSLTVAQQLKQQYANVNKAESTTLSAPSLATLPTNVSGAPQAQPIKQKFDQMLKNGLIVQDGTDYLLSLEYKDGMINLNGKSMTLGDFAGMLNR